MRERLGEASTLKRAGVQATTKRTAAVAVGVPTLETI